MIDTSHPDKYAVQVFYRAGNSDKQYTIAIERDIFDPLLYCVRLSWGRLGASGQSKVEGPMTLLAACRMAEAQLRRKIARGYTHHVGEMVGGDRYGNEFSTVIVGEHLEEALEAEPELTRFPDKEDLQTPPKVTTLRRIKVRPK